MPERGEIKTNPEQTPFSWKEVPKVRKDIVELETLNYPKLMRGIRNVIRTKLPDVPEQEVLLTGVNGISLKRNKGSGDRLWTFASTLEETSEAIKSGGAISDPFRFAKEEGSGLPAIVLFDKRLMVPALEDPRFAEVPGGMRYKDHYTVKGRADNLWVMPVGHEEVNEAMLATVFYKEAAPEVAQNRDQEKLAGYMGAAMLALANEEHRAA